VGNGSESVFIALVVCIGKIGGCAIGNARLPVGFGLDARSSQLI
jgi:hypothetical protein